MSDGLLKIVSAVWHRWFTTGDSTMRYDAALSGFLIESLESRQLLSTVSTSPGTIVAYFPDYRFSSWNSISLSGLSEINYFSIIANDDGSLPTTSSSGFSLSQLKTVVTASHAASPRVAVSIVIDPGTDFLTIAQSPTATANFINNILAFSSTYNLDGIDLDYEPGTLTTAQKNTWGSFLGALHSQTSAHALILSEAVQASQMIIPKADLGDIDRYNLMDYALEYNSSAPYSDSITYLTNWANYGVPKSKLIMGVPFYASSGTSWSNSTAETYGQIAAAYASANGGVYPAASLNSVTINGVNWGYNGITTLQQKASYVLQNGYGGMMIWELGQDLFVNNQYNASSLLPAVTASFSGTPSVVVNANTLIVNAATAGGATAISEAGGSINITQPAGNYAVSSSTVNSILITGTGGTDTLNVTSTLDKPLNFIGNGAARDTLNVSSGSIDLQAPTAGAGIMPEALGALSIGSGAGVALLSATSHADRTLLMLNALSIAGSTGTWAGQLDLQSNDLLVHGGNLTTITNQLATGFNATGGSNWMGDGLTSSTAASSPLTALGVTSGLTTFDGYTVAPSDILVKYTYFGDANLDGKVDASDYSLIDSGLITHATGWSNGDFNYDGVINGSDYTLIDNAFNTQGASLAAEISPKFQASRVVSSAAQLATVFANSWASSPQSTVASQLFSTDSDELMKRSRFSTLPIFI